MTTVKTFEYRGFEIGLYETAEGSYTVIQCLNDITSVSKGLTDLRVALSVFDTKLENFLYMCS